MVKYKVSTEYEIDISRCMTYIYDDDTIPAKERIQHLTDISNIANHLIEGLKQQSMGKQ